MLFRSEWRTRRAAAGGRPLARLARGIDPPVEQPGDLVGPPFEAESVKAWASGRPLDVVQRSIENSLAFGVYKENHQVGFARVVTDYATFAWVADVFVLTEHRGRGLSKWLMEVMLSHRRLQGFRRWVLATKDAHELYARFGFIPMHRPERWMERPDPNMLESPDYWKNDPQN